MPPTDNPGLSFITSPSRSYLLVEDFDQQIDTQFQTEVAEDYFRTLFKDVAARSVSPRTDTFPERFVDNVAFFEYTKLPGIICDRFFNMFERAKLGNYVTEEEFVKGFINVYLASIHSKMLMTFKM